VSDLWVVNASPVIALARVNKLGLLRDLCRELLVPLPVAAEVLAGAPSDPARQAIQRGWGTPVAAERVPPELIEWGLGPGETAVLAVALERRPATAVLDDAAARACANALRVPVIGTLGVVVRARKQGLIPSAADLLTALRAAGLYLDDDVVKAALETVGESWG
jgi:predicted nucleic acid-binding protein